MNPAPSTAAAATAVERASVIAHRSVERPTTRRHSHTKSSTASQHRKPNTVMARATSKIAPGWWDYTTLDPEICSDAARLSPEDMLAMSRDGFQVVFYKLVGSVLQIRFISPCRSCILR